jgi:hypothetical protein
MRNFPLVEIMIISYLELAFDVFLRVLEQQHLIEWRES